MKLLLKSFVPNNTAKSATKSCDMFACVSKNQTETLPRELKSKIGLTKQSNSDAITKHKIPRDLTILYKSNFKEIYIVIPFNNT